MRHLHRVSSGTRTDAAIQLAISLFAATFFFWFVESSMGGNKIGGGTSVVFASVQEGQKILATRDDFIERMGPFDRAARMKTDAEVPEEVYLRFLASNVLEWKGDEKTMVNAALEQLRPQLESLSLPFPKVIHFVKTTGHEEGGQQYTRGSAVMLNARILISGQDKALRQCIAHELFHVLSRHNPELRDKCFAAIGFQACREATLPPDLRPQRLTNPDAPKNDHYIELKFAGKSVGAIPIIFSKEPKYDVQKGGEFFGYVQFKFLIVAMPDRATQPKFSDKDAQLVDMDKVTGFFEQIGNNTQYIIHPEEILADNFSLLVRDEKVASPEILRKLKLALSR